MKKKLKSEKSSSKSIFFMHILLLQKKQILLMILYLLIFGLIFILFPLMGRSESEFFKVAKNDFMFYHMAAIMAISIFPVIYNFKFLTSPEEADFVFSLPQNRVELFFSRYLSGLFSVIIPFALVYFAGAYIYGSCFLGIDENWGEYFQIVVAFLLAFIFFYSLAIFIFIHFGRITSGVVYYILLSTLTAIFLYYAFNETVSSMFGAVNDLNYLSNNEADGFTSNAAVILLSNIPFLFPTFFAKVINCIFFINNAAAQFISFYIFIALFAALFIVLSVLIIKKRRGDQAQRTGLFSYLDKILIIVCCVTIGELLTNYINSVFLMVPRLLIFLILSGICFYILSAFINKSLKVNLKLALNYLIVFGVYGLFALIIATGGLGRIYYVPDVSRVTSADIYLPKNDGGFDVYTKTGNIRILQAIGNNDQIHLSSKSGLSDLTSFNKALNTNYNSMRYKEIHLMDIKKGLTTVNNRLKIYIKYNLNNGLKIYRYYDCYIDSEVNDAETLIFNEDFLNQCVNIIDNKLKNSSWKYTRNVAIDFTKPDSYLFPDDIKDFRKDDMGYQVKSFFNPKMLFTAFFEDDIKIKSTSMNVKDIYLMQMDYHDKSVSGTTYDKILSPEDYGLTKLVITPLHKKTWAMLKEAGIFDQLKDQTRVKFTHAHIFSLESYNTILLNNSMDSYIFRNQNQCFNFVVNNSPVGALGYGSTINSQDEIKKLYDVSYAIAPAPSLLNGYRVVFSIESDKELKDYPTAYKSVVDNKYIYYYTNVYYISSDKMPESIKAKIK